MDKKEGGVQEIRQKMISALVETRLAQNISQAELARRVGTQRSNICRFESGQQNVTLDFYIRIVRALGNGEEKMTEILWEAGGKEPSSKGRTRGIYSLRLFDEELMSFMMESRGLEGLGARILWINKKKKELLPPDMEISEAGIIKWLRRRVVPKKRAFVDEILKSLGLGFMILAALSTRVWVFRSMTAIG